MQPSQPKCGDSRQFEINNEIYTTDDYYQEELVSIDVLGILRGANIGRLNISPIRYNPVTNVITISKGVGITSKGFLITLDHSKCEYFRQDYKANLNPNSLETLTDCRVEPSLAGATPESAFQFERLGYFCVDRDSTEQKLIINRTVTLRDAWAKVQKQAKQQNQKKQQKPRKKKRKE